MTYAPNDVLDAGDTTETEVIDYAGRKIACPVAAHPQVDEIRVLLANGENHEYIAQKFGIPAAHVEGRENQSPEAGEFVRKYKARHPWASVHSVDQARELKKLQDEAV